MGEPEHRDLVAPAASLAYSSSSSARQNPTQPQVGRVTRARQRELDVATEAKESQDKRQTDRKGKKRAKPSSPDPPSNPESSDLSEPESEPEPPRKKQRVVTKQKQKSKAKVKQSAKGKARAKMPRKPIAPKTKSSGGPSNERAKKGDLSSFLHDEDLEMDDDDEANWVEDDPSGPMDDEHDEDEDEEDEHGAGPSGTSNGLAGVMSNSFGRFSGMDAGDAAAAMFGGGFQVFGGFGGGGLASRFKNLRSRLKSPKSSVRLEALQECSELLLVANEDTLASTFSIEGFATEFIAILDGKPNITGGVADEEDEPDEDAQLAAALAMSSGEEMPAFGNEAEAQLVACRCLAHLLEAIPGVGHTLVHLGAVRVLCAKLKEISYIELAEQTLSTLEKISSETPSYVVKEGGLGALLNFLDFFNTNVQRTAVTAAANCCKNISPDSYTFIRDVFPVLRQVLSYSDQRLVEQATLAVVRTLESYRHNASHLEGLLDGPTVSAINALLIPSGGSPLLSSGTYTHLLKSLTTAARTSPNVSIAFLEAGMTDTLYQILTGVLPPTQDEGGQVANMAVLQNLAHRPKEQVEEALALITELLPPLPKDGVFDARAYSERALTKLNRASRHSTRLEPGGTGASTIKPKKDSEIRIELLKSKPDLVSRFTRAIVPVLVDVYAASVSQRVRLKVLMGLLKAVAFAEPEELQAVLHSVPMASFLAAIISSKDNPMFVLAALQLVECLVEKLPQVYHSSFRREGVVYEVELLAGQETQAAKTPVVKAEPGEHVASIDEEDGPKPIVVPDLGRARTPSTPADLMDANIFRARILGAKRTFETADGEQDNAALALHQLELLVARLGDDTADEDQLRETMREIASHFTDADGVLSSFELLKSGLVDALLTFVTADGSVSQDTRRALLFEAFTAGPNGGPSPLWMLVKRLHESLSRLEDFEVETVKMGPVQDASRGIASPLARSVRLRLQPEEGQDFPKPPMTIGVTIQGLAHLQMLHEYIRPKIAGGGEPRTMATLLSALAASGGGGSDATARLLAALSSRGLDNSPEIAALRSALGQHEAAPAAESSTAATDGSVPGPSTAAEAPSVEGETAAQADAPPKAKVQRRRSARLSAANAEAATSTAASAFTGIPLSSAVAALQAGGVEMDVDFEDEDGYSEDEFDQEIYEGEMEEDLPPVPEKTVDMDLAADGKTVVAKTPDGTRVPTPAQGSSAPATSSARQGSYASAVKAPAIDWHLEFRLDGHKLSMADTVYGVLHKYGRSSPGVPQSAYNVFNSNVVIMYRKVSGPAPEPEPVTAVASSPEPSSATSLPASLGEDAPTAKILRLLNVVHSLSAEARDLWPALADTQLDEALFVNNKLTAKLTRQLEETMIVASYCMADWSLALPKNYPFLFPFETRYAFLQSSSFGNERLLMRWQAAQPRNPNRRDDGISTLIRLPRNKVRISRTSILESASKVLDLYGAARGILEVEYFEEIGTGLGPTLEFYTLVSKEFARRSLGIWRDEDSAKAGKYVVHQKGLFPSPIAPTDKPDEATQARLHHFKILGLFVGRALLDSRIIDVNLNKVFLKLILGQRVPKTFASLRLVDPDFARTLEALHTYKQTRKEIEDISTLTPEAKADKLASITVKGVKIEDLSLDFTLPGYDIELKPGGSDIAVDDSSVEEYLDLVLDLTLGAGVEAQVRAFQQGFSDIFPVQDLKIFSPDELKLLFGNTDEDWSRETLEQALKADHGYNSDSRAVKNLLETMASYDKATRREFLQFVTGAPKLPIGGFRGLNPPFTVVRKPHEPPYKADDYLPSVMTCAQYLKMPDYSSRAVLETQLGRAMREGGQAFHLS